MIDFHRNRPFQSGQADHNPMSLRAVHEKALPATERTAAQSHALSYLEKGPRLDVQIGFDGILNSVDLGIIYRNRDLADFDNMNNARNRQNGEPVLRFKAAENVSGKQRQIDRFGAI
jgi:hypothetical protein